MDKPKKEILEVPFCDILMDNCPNPEIPCDKCIIEKKRINV